MVPSAFLGTIETRRADVLFNREVGLATHYQTALITGAGSGIGQATARELSQIGIRCALAGRRQEALERTRRELGDAAGSALVVTCDVADRDQVKTMVERVRTAFGSIDVLVCNAGSNIQKRALESLDPADWDKLIATNLTGAFNLVHYVLPSMRERQRGLVIQIASIAGKRASMLGGTAYSASKFGQAALGICLGREEHGRGIRSSVIYPGEVNTPILDERPVAVAPDRRAAILQPEDVAMAVRFLVELNPRANVPELVIQPTVDEFY
jgi:NADP-dependent 3-hydroxy acid dehydrogenase YdfG